MPAIATTTVEPITTTDYDSNITTSAPAIPTDLYCEVTYQTWGDLCYIYVNESLPWEQAVDFCMTDVGGSLVSIKSEQEQEFLLNISSIYSGKGLVSVLRKCSLNFMRFALLTDI